MKKKRKWKWLVLLLIVLALAGGMLLRPDEGAMYSEAKVTRGDIRTTYSFTGSLIAPRSQIVSAMAAGSVRAVYVEQNERVKEGDRLLALSTGEVIRAEMDGEIVALNAEANEPVVMGETLVTVMDMERMEAEIYVDEYDVDAIELNRAVSVTVNALDESCEGSVKSFSKVATPMGTMAAYKANIRMEVPEKALPGMQVEVKMLNQEAKDTLLLKVDALQFDEENQVYVLTRDAEGAYQPTYIETGINDGTIVQVLSGLEEGDTVYYAAGIDIMAMMQAMRGGR